MKIVSVTMTESRERTIEGAIRSVMDVVDEVLVVDTGILDDTMGVILRTAGADKVHARSFSWRDAFSAARNFCLAFASERGADWAILLDSDERYAWNGLDPREYLASLGEKHAAVLLRTRSGTYPKERIIKIPARARFSSRTHEAFPSKGCPEMPSARTFEVPKSADEIRRKYERDQRILEAEVAERPSPRAWFYLGECRRHFHDFAGALQAHEACFRTTGWDQEGAWSAYMAAQSAASLGRRDEAIEWCARGLTKHAEVAELAWYAAFLNHERGDLVQCGRWSRIAIGINDRARTDGPLTPRTSFSYPLALYDGPHDLLRRAYLALGMPERAADEEKLRAKAMRERAGIPMVTKESDVDDGELRGMGAAAAIACSKRLNEIR